ncbi:hypothetical protein GCM10027190_47170 [Spirosoma areae]
MRTVLSGSAVGSDEVVSMAGFMEEDLDGKLPKTSLANQQKLDEVMKNGHERARSEWLSTNKRTRL